MKCLQVENNLCLTGSADSTVRLWDLTKVDDEDDWEKEMHDIPEEQESVDEMGNRVTTNGSAIRQGSNSPDSSAVEKEGPCIRALEGHTKAVTALYFEDECLVCISWSVHRDAVNESSVMCRSQAPRTRPCASGI